ncbi:isatin hydrolase-like [Brevipalpus obovatus]|uniref:isatin hydrolase-like n=1 Tax=Brevipalpus obovatus TaxID=246614 RepID=UPI003D9EF834
MASYYLITFTLLLLISLNRSPIINASSDHNAEGLLYDLTYSLNNITLDWSGKQFQLNITQENVQEDNISYWYQIDELASPTHLGTHLDAPCHFAKDKWCTSEIPVNRLFARPGYVIDITDKCANDRDYELNENDLLAWLEEHGKDLQRGAVILVRTGWSKYWPNRADYFGAVDMNESYHFPGVSPSAAKLMVSHENIDLYGLGIESPSVDRGMTKDYQTHVILGSHNVYNLENIGPLIANLPPKGFLVTALPLRIDGSSGSPVRVVVHFKTSSADYLYVRMIFTFLSIIPILYYSIIS